MKLIFDQRLFLGLNCQSREQYVATMTPYGNTQAKKLYSVATKFDDVTKSLIGKQLSEVVSSESLKDGQSTDLEDNVKNIGQVGIEKLYELTKIDDDDLKELIKKGKVEINGSDITIADVVDSTGKELQLKLSEALKKHKAKISQQAEEINLLKEEKKTDKKEFEALKKKEADLTLIQAQYGPMATLIEQKKKYLVMAEEQLDSFMKIFNNANIEQGDPESLRQHCQEITRKINTYYDNAQNLYIDVYPELE